MTALHDRIITPDTDPARFTAEEAKLFRWKMCGWATGSGDHPEVVRCGRASKPGVSFGHCEMHDAEMLVGHFPDGTARADEDPRWHLRADCQERVNAMIAAHQRNCTDRDCECRGDS